ncbi:hypothetical protein J1C52_14990, partial [Roseibaca sp. Y0-43]|nr:hypothetical protein [Roseibaca sp. Y0-43]
MYSLTETTDWSGEFDFSSSDYGHIQTGHTVSGTVGGEDLIDLVPLSLAVGETYTFSYEGNVSLTILDGGIDTMSPDYEMGAAPIVTGNSITFTAHHPSDAYAIAISGDGEYSVTWEGIAADHLQDEDLGNLASAPDLLIGSSITGVLNGTDNGGGFYDFTPETDYFEFTAFAGQTYHFSMVQASSIFGASSGGHLILKDANGDEVSGVTWSASAWEDGATLSFTPDSTGVYYIGAQSWFGFAGAYVLESYTDNNAPNVSASVSDPVFVTTGAGASEILVTVSLDSVAMENISGVVDLTFVDGNYSIPAEEQATNFTIAAGTQSVTLRFDVETLPLTGHETYVIASLGSVIGAGIETGFGDNLYINPASDMPTPNDDQLIGTDDTNTIRGLGGADVIEGLGGNDVLVGNAGSDTIWGGLG